MMGVYIEKYCGSSGQDSGSVPQKTLLGSINPVSLDSYLKTAFFCATQNGFNYFHADFFIG